MPAKSKPVFNGRTVVADSVNALAASILGSDYRPDFVLAAPSGHYGRLIPAGRKSVVWLIPRKDGCIRVIYRMPADATDAATGKVFKAAGCRPCDGRDWQNVVTADKASIAACRKLVEAAYSFHGLKAKPTRKRTPAKVKAAAPATTTTPETTTTTEAATA